MANNYIPRPAAPFHARRNNFVTYVNGHPANSGLPIAPDRPERAELPVGGHAHAVRGRLPWRRPLTPRRAKADNRLAIEPRRGHCGVKGRHDRRKGTACP